jgi:GNAT superfamily N-acetyltransferase
MTYTLRPFGPEHYPRMVEIINQLVREPVSVDDLLREDRLRSKEDPYLRLGAFSADGDLMGYGMAQGGAGRLPGEFWTRVRVDPRYQRQGVGQALYGEMLAFAKAHGATRLESIVREDHPEALAWAERRGFVKEHHFFESTLPLAEWDPTPFRPVVDDLLASGIRFTTLAEEIKGGDRVAALRRFYEFSFKLEKDVPGHADRPDVPWDRYLERVLNDPHWKDEWILLAADGDRWVALCQLVPQSNGSLYNGFTAVDREYRGRNIALAIKVKSLDLAKATGAPYIRTHNHSVNQPMLAVNRKLGYQPLPGAYLLAASI